MRTNFRLPDLIPPALAAGSVSESANAVIVTAKALSRIRSCPRCGTTSNSTRIAWDYAPGRARPSR